MRNLRGRLRRLEQRQKLKQPHLSWWDFIGDPKKDDWFPRHGYRDAEHAIAENAIGPVEMTNALLNPPVRPESLLQKWERYEAEVAAGTAGPDAFANWDK